MRQVASSQVQVLVNRLRHDQHIVQTQAGGLEDLQQQRVAIRPFTAGDALAAQFATLANVERRGA